MIVRLAALVVLLAACHRGARGAPCSAVAGRFFTVARAELGSAHVAPSLRRGVADQLPAMRDALAKACEDGAWSAKVRDCMVRAETHVAIEACEAELSAAQRAALDRSAHPRH